MKAHLMLAAAVVAAGVLPAVAQSGSPNPDVLSALLGEVRALRIAMERASSTAPQIQLLAARLTVQNERLSRATRDADEAHRELEKLLAEVSTLTAQSTHLEEALTGETDPARLRELKSEQLGVKSILEERAMQEPRIRARENELANQVTVEQGQWAELNRRLDELERELATRRPQ